MRWFKKRSPKQSEQPPERQASAARADGASNENDALLPDDPEAQRRRVAAAPDSDTAQQLINTLAPAQDLRITLYLARRDLGPALWNDPALASESALVAIEHHSRSNNKAVNREARRRLKTLRSARQKLDALEARAQELIESATRINNGSELRDRDLKARELLEEQWQSLSTQWLTLIDSLDSDALLPPLPALNERLPRVDEATVAAAQAAADAERQQAAAQQQAEQEAARAQAAMSEQAQAAATLARDVAVAQSRFAELAPGIDEALSAALSEVDDTLPGVARAARRAQRQQLRQLLRQLDWPEGAQTPVELDGLVSAEQTLSNRIATLDAACAAERTRLQEAITALTALLADGQTRAAGILHGEIRRAQPNHYDLPKSALSALGKASGELRQLGAWQQYVTSPKRQALCDAMQAAAQAPLEPALQAERIKELRAQWQALGPPRDESDRAAQKQFDAHAETAFEPARAHFAQLAQQREENAQAREDICTQLEAYLNNTDWQQADFDAAERILKEARNSWRAFHPIPRKREAALRERFEALQDQLHGKLKAFWDHNAQAKTALIERATALGSQQDTPLTERIEQAKTLQSEWKRIGRVPHKRDQALWQDFRSACDALFQERDAKASAESERIEAERQAIQALLTGFSATLAETTSATADAATLKAFRSTLREQLPALPGALRRSSEKEAEALIAQYQRLLQEASTLTLRNDLASFQQWDTAASNDSQVPAGAPDDLFIERPDLDHAQWQELLRQQAIGAEMAADIDSPASDSAERMALKVARLQQTMGRNPEPKAEDVLEQAKAWCALGRKPDTEAIGALRERFFTALQAQLAAS